MEVLVLFPHYGSSSAQPLQFFQNYLHYLLFFLFFPLDLPSCFTHCFCHVPLNTFAFFDYSCSLSRQLPLALLTTTTKLAKTFDAFQAVLNALVGFVNIRTNAELNSLLV